MMSDTKFKFKSTVKAVEGNHLKGKLKFTLEGTSGLCHMMETAIKKVLSDYDKIS